ncbi:MAG: DUF1016 N-terminal domain-containing protein, partial [Pseudomonadota bacterium]
MKANKSSIVRSGAHGYEAVLADVVRLIQAGRSATARSANAVMTATYWGIGRRIVEHEQGGRRRAEYGAALIERLADDLTAKCGRGFGRRNLFQMRAFYLAYSEIVQTPSAELATGGGSEKVQIVSAQSALVAGELPRFPLPWSHYVRLLAVASPTARRFYEQEALRGGWTIEQMDRQIGSQFYERTALSRNKAAMLRKG